jgi:prepilin-type N-terminal cleavage/methylation domain-containing protein
MIMYRRKQLASWKHQQGFTLIELLVAGFISLIVTSGMVILMASTLGTGTQTIKMTQLSAEMRTAMQIMTRELRRANYHSSYANCFGDTDCLVTQSIDAKVSEININVGGDCFWFFYDRPERCTSTPCDPDDQTLLSDLDTEDTLAAFRLSTVTTDGIDIGSIQMTTTGTGATTSCPTAGWVNITNPGFIDIQDLVVNDSVAGFLSYVLTNDADMSVERIGITLTGRLRENDLSLPTFMQNTNAPTLAIQDYVRVRNDIVRPQP